MFDVRIKLLPQKIHGNAEISRTISTPCKCVGSVTGRANPASKKYCHKNSKKSIAIEFGD